ncbi:hypothetical protein D3C81_2049380 [compost metagenome]
MCDSGRLINRYRPATQNQISKVENEVVIASRPLLVSSVMAITETSEVSLTRLMNCPASGGSTRLKACGRITWRID